MKKISMICMAAGLACAVTAVAKPPMQLAENGIFVLPKQIAQVKIVNGQFVYGEWQDYSPISTRGDKAVFYSFDCFESYNLNTGEYPNKVNGGQGSPKYDPRYPTDTTCGMGSGRWYFGPTYVNALTVDDVTSLGCFDQGNNAVDSLDFAWYWGSDNPTSGTPCVISFFTSDADGTCAVSDPLVNFSTGVAFNFGNLFAGGYYFTNIDGIDSDAGLFVDQPGPGGSYLMALTDGTFLNTFDGTQMMLWGTGDSLSNTPYRPGTQITDGWDDDSPISGVFESSECYGYDFGTQYCPGVMGKMVAMGSYRCPADVNNDGFVNGDDYDAFASAFDVADLCADYNGDGFVNGDDYDAFASNFDAGC